MYIVGVDNCEDCKIYKAKYPQYTYYHLKKEEDTAIGKRLKKIIWDNKDRTKLMFPVLINDDITQIIKVRSEILKELNRKDPNFE